MDHDNIDAQSIGDSMEGVEDCSDPFDDRNLIANVHHDPHQHVAHAGTSRDHFFETSGHSDVVHGGALLNELQGEESADLLSNDDMTNQNKTISSDGESMDTNANSEANENVTVETSGYGANDRRGILLEDWEDQEATIINSDEDVGIDDDNASCNSSSDEGGTNKNAAYYFKHREDSLYAGCQLTVLQVAFTLLSFKLQLHLSNVAMEKLCWLLAKVLLPADNHMPHSLYHLHKLCGVESSIEAQRHCCWKDHYVWPYLSKNKWKGHKDDKCPKCGENRFVNRRGDRSSYGGLKPAKVLYYFGLEQCIKHLHSLPMWNAARAQVDRNVNTDECKTLFGSKYSQLLNTRLGNKLCDARMGLYEIATDWFSFFTDQRQKYTTGLFLLRAIDLLDKFRQKRMFHVPLLIVPGPRQPKTVKAYVGLIVEDFMNCLCQGINVERVTFSQQERGSVNIERTSTQHWPILASWVGDNPARQKVGEFRGHGAKRACAYCWMEGQYIQGNEHAKGKMVYLGYSQKILVAPETIPTRDLHRPLRLNVGDQIGLKSTVEMVKAGEMATPSDDLEKEVWDANRAGCNGLSAVARLPYTDYKDIWALGVAHILLLGVVADFMKLIFSKAKRGRQYDYVISHDSRRIIRHRLTNIKLPAGRPKPLCIVEQRGNFDMSQWWMHVK